MRKRRHASEGKDISNLDILPFVREQLRKNDTWDIKEPEATLRAKPSVVPPKAKVPFRYQYENCRQNLIGSNEHDFDVKEYY